MLRSRGQLMTACWSLGQQAPNLLLFPIAWCQWTVMADYQSFLSKLTLVVCWLVFLLWMFSRWRRVWCFLPHCLLFGPSQSSDLCPGRRQLKQSFLTFISSARSLTESFLNFPHLKILCVSSQHSPCCSEVSKCVCKCCWFPFIWFSVAPTLFGAVASSACARFSKKSLSSAYLWDFLPFEDSSHCFLVSVGSFSLIK